MSLNALKLKATNNQPDHPLLKRSAQPAANSNKPLPQNLADMRFAILSMVDEPKNKENIVISTLGFIAGLGDFMLKFFMPLTLIVAASLCIAEFAHPGTLQKFSQIIWNFIH